MKRDIKKTGINLPELLGKSKLEFQKFLRTFRKQALDTVRKHKVSAV
jgi:hypothetical protein